MSHKSSTFDLKFELIVSNRRSERSATAHIMSAPDTKPAAEETAADDKYKYKIDEKVLCYHGPLIYEAKCLKRRNDNNITQYYVHYNGWNKNWDEWVHETRILKINPQNQKLQQELKAKHKPQNTGASKKRKSNMPPEIGGKESNGFSDKKAKTDGLKSDKSNGQSLLNFSNLIVLNV